MMQFSVVILALCTSAVRVQAFIGLEARVSLQAESSRVVASDLAKQSFTSRKLAQITANATDICLSYCQADASPLSVCANGTSYSNLCEPICNDMNITYYGSCSPSPCLCPSLFSFVCGADRRTYFSPCFAACANVTAYTHGACVSDCNCTNTTAPVCAKDGKTYDNVCKASCAGVEEWYSGPCDARIGNCSCDTTYQPVCGQTVSSTPLMYGTGSYNTTTNNTYMNPCLASCDGASVIANGSCADDTPWNVATFWCNCSLALDPVCVNISALNQTTTVANACVAKCLNYTILGSGVCNDVITSCDCPFPTKPVCAGNVTYPNACMARCKGNATTWTNGTCAAPPRPPSRGPPALIPPALGGNPPYSIPSGLIPPALPSGPIPPASGGSPPYSIPSGLIPPAPANIADCLKCPIPTDTSSLVCGSDGTTYPNACYAQCNGATVVNTGVCSTDQN